jgi:2-iminobutanoate/2-iminopropanoate deaminase
MRPKPLPKAVSQMLRQGAREAVVVAVCGHGAKPQIAVSAHREGGFATLRQHHKAEPLTRRREEGVMSVSDPSSVFSAEAGPPGGHYSHAMVAGDLIFTAGHIAVDGDAATLKGATVFDQTLQVVKNLRSVLKAGGSSLDRVLKTTVFLVDIDDFPEFNRAYEQAFGDHRPARSTVAVSALVRGALVEIECVALRERSR